MFTSLLLSAGSSVDFATALPWLCSVTGFLVLPGALGVFVFAYRRRRKRRLRGAKAQRALDVAVAGSTGLVLVWFLSAIDLRFFEPSIDDVSADMIVENILEVRQFTLDGKAAGMTRKVRPTATDAANMPRHTLEFAVGDCDPQGHVTPVWNTFRVSTSAGTVWVLQAPGSKTWLTLAQWRESRPATRPTSRPDGKSTFSQP